MSLPSLLLTGFSKKTSNWIMWKERKQLHDWYYELLIGLFNLTKYLHFSWKITLSLAIMPFLHCSPPRLPVPFVTTAPYCSFSLIILSQSYFSYFSYPLALSLLQHWGQTRKANTGSQYVCRIQWPKTTPLWNAYRFHTLFCVHL